MSYSKIQTRLWCCESSYNPISRLISTVLLVQSTPLCVLDFDLSITRVWLFLPWGLVINKQWRNSSHHVHLNNYIHILQVYDLNNYCGKQMCILQYIMLAYYLILMCILFTTLKLTSKFMNFVISLEFKLASYKF